MIGQFSKGTEVGLTACIYLLRHPREVYAADMLAEEIGAAPSYLAKVLHVLAKAGIVESVRGRTGGFRMPDTDATVLDIMRATEGLVTAKWPAVIPEVQKVRDEVEESLTTLLGNMALLDL